MCGKWISVCKTTLNFVVKRLKNIFSAHKKDSRSEAGMTMN